MSSASITPTNPPVESRPPSNGGDADDERRAQWLVVQSAGTELGIPIEQVREVVRPGGLRAVPGAPRIQAGIVNVRGAIVTVLDLRALRTGERAVTPGSIVLLQYGARPIGLAVESVRDVFVAEVEQTHLPSHIEPLDAVALCARHLHSAEERTR